MTKVVNLRTVRKSRARDEKRQKGDEAAAEHGRTKAERRSEEDAAARAARHLDSHRRDPEG